MIFKRKKKKLENFNALGLINDIALPLTPFGEKITNSDVVLICIDRIASQCAKLKGRCIKRSEDGIITERNKNLSFLLKSKPNEYMTPYQFIYKVVSLLLLNDNAFVYPLYDRDTFITLELKALYPLNPTIVEPIMDKSETYYLKFYFESGESFILPKENVIHLRRFYTGNDIFGGSGSKSSHEALLKTLGINDALLQKTFTVDFLNHKTKKNEGEVPQYYVHDSHPAIITKKDWELVQIELNRRKGMGYTYSFKNPFSGKLICEDCGSYYGKKKWHSGTIHEKEILQCNFKFKHKCMTPNLDEEEVKSMFLKAYNEMIRSKDLLISNLIEAVSKALDTSSLDKQIETLSNELKDMNKEFELLVKMNTTTQQDQTIWRKKYAELEDIYKNKEAELNSLIAKKNEIKLKVNKFNIFIETLKKGELIADFDEAIFNFNLEKAIVHKDKSITFKFYSGFETILKAEE